jgi:hypothetical protein
MRYQYGERKEGPEALIPEGPIGTDYTLKHTNKNLNPHVWITVKGDPKKNIVCENCSVTENFHKDGACTDKQAKRLRWKPVTASLSVYVKRTDEGVVVDIYQKGFEDLGRPITSAYAFFVGDA